MYNYCLGRNMKLLFLKGGNIRCSRWRSIFQSSRSTFPRQPPPSPPCSCTRGSVLLKDLLPKEQRERLAQIQQNGTSSVLSKLLYALPNSPLQYPIQGYTVRSLISIDLKCNLKTVFKHSSSLVFLNELLAKVSYTSSIYHINTGDLVLCISVTFVFLCPSDIQSQVTILTKTFLRYPQLKVLLASIQQFYPNITVIIADDSLEPERISGKNIQQYIMPPAQGWFAGRNLAVSQVITKYFLWVDDDFIFTQNTKIEEFLKVGGSLEGNTGNRFCFSLLYEEGDDVEGGCLIRKYGETFHPLPDFPKCSFTHGVVNFFLARTDAVRRVGFDPQLQRVGHSEFFMDGLGLMMVATCKDVEVGHQRKTKENNNPRYQEFRKPKNIGGFKSQLHYFKNHLKCVRYSFKASE
uniref:Glycosyltransferase 2-like domain-containing protein n=1 Tax=Salarias fasciatus TaxID=181472 RepID=A0A672IAK2_SALFA